MTNVVQFPAEPGISSSSDWPEAEGVRDAFAIAAMMLMNAAAEHGRRLAQSPLWTISPVETVSLPNIVMGGRSYSLDQIFDMAGTLDEPMPISTRAFLHLWRKNFGAEAPPLASYREASAHMQGVLAYWQQQEAVHGHA